MARVISNERPPYEPYVCAVTGRGEPNDYIDLETVITQEGHLFVLKSVIENIAKVNCGMVKAERVQSITERMEDLSDELEELREASQAIETLKEHLETIEPERTPV